MLNVYYYRGELPPLDRLRDSSGTRAESAVWRRLLSLALTDAGYPAALCDRILFAERGRPCFPPQTGLDLSPTHTQGLVAVALCDGEVGTIGIDAEAKKGRDIPRLLRAAERWFTPAETARIRAAAEQDTRLAETTFLRVWTAKEALVKRSGTGLAGMRSADSDAPQGCVLHATDLGDALLTVAAPTACGSPVLHLVERSKLE